MRTRSSNRFEAGLLLLVIAVVAAVMAPVGAETGDPRTEAVLTVVTDSTAPDPVDDGVIRTHDVAVWRLNVSQNGADAPADVVATLIEEPDPHAPLGAKGVGEPPCISSTPAIVNAIRAGISSTTDTTAPISKFCWPMTCL